ncbi:hypothetical protein AA12717_3750 [Gluconacetobacter sacchari DSM 12717]|uniref:RepB-like DNA primase domain-containing protein n=2 Tax=Gluconacetobacter sacchari TaxID=92759 RepID=A0A7W4NQD4_9PROT|nr:DNA-primase RepB domain-containing protein [Gluconacetobacter sacchari]MBB2158985.1 hypothetical protein [Gluconacetobacter sacchari]GBQ31396.1 hypothetical protein AA12717_3750 [Gluconacetobacter sacchari DSM 12717]
MADLTPEEVARLRRLDPAGVHAALIAAGDLSISAPLPKRVGDLRPADNAIDAVMWARKCDYNQSLGWLHENLGDDRTHERNVGKGEMSRDLFGSEAVINKLVKQQMDALGCSEARLTLMFKQADETIQANAETDTVTESDLENAASDREDKPGKMKTKFGYLVGKRTENGEKREKFFNTKDIQNSVGLLRKKNSEGMNVLITPMDNHAFYVLIDDARPITGSDTELPVKSWIEAGYKPCLALQTSWNSHQIIFRVPKEPFRRQGVTSGTDDQMFDRRGLNQFFTDLNQKHGDPRISGLRHGIRLAGYRNMKPKHARDVEGKAWSVEFPFIEITHAESVFCEKTMRDALKFCASDVVGNIEARRDAIAQHMAERASRDPDQPPPRTVLPPRGGVPPVKTMVASGPAPSPPSRAITSAPVERPGCASDQPAPRATLPPRGGVLPARNMVSPARPTPLERQIASSDRSYARHQAENAQKTAEKPQCR